MNFFFIRLILFALAIFLNSCYTEKKAARQIIKAKVSYPEKVASYCGQFYPSSEKQIDSIIYIKGIESRTKIPVHITDTILIKDLAIPLNVNREFVSRIDTVLMFKNKVIKDRGETKALELENIKLIKANAGIAKINSILIKVLIVLSVYTLLRWLLRIWHIRLP